MLRLSGKVILISVMVMCTMTNGYGQNFSTTIKGQIIGKKVDTLLVQKVTGDLRANAIKIPVTNGNYSRTIKANNREAYEIVYSYQHKQGRWRPIEFMVESGKIELKLYPEEPDKNTIKGGKLNDELRRLRQQADSISKEGRKIMKRLRSDAPDSLSREQLDSYIKSHPAMDSLKNRYYTIYSNYFKTHTNALSYYLVWDINSKKDRHDIPPGVIKDSNFTSGCSVDVQK